MLTVKNLTITNHLGKTLLDHFDMVLNDKDKMAIIGEEGNGKSTLMKALLGMELSYVNISGRIDRTHENIGYLSQVFDPSWNQSTPYEYCLKENENDIIAPEKYN